MKEGEEVCANFSHTFFINSSNCCLFAFSSLITVIASLAKDDEDRRLSTSRRHSRVFQASAEGPLFIFIINNDEALSMLKLNEDVVGDSKARVSEQMEEIRSAVEMVQLEAEKKHDEVVDEMLAMLNAKAEASRLKEVEQEVGKDVDEE
ncbi:hypothetical protein LOK49_LG10G01845 [Camellia lanceoleosa]|uniref:Uncharacterized protein n=1 Tax=Camellia lanceoleosa TaxID=1840588 RepID=A0ACC0G8G8_9ERIC|nr:hypothetical protein LOK49_LG10G01845 [Camellia lanceoleosa]